MNNKTYHLYTDEEKLKIVKDHINNRIPIRACATKYNISITSLVYWLRKYRENGVDGLKSMIGKHRGPNFKTKKNNRRTAKRKPKVTSRD